MSSALECSRLNHLLLCQYPMWMQVWILATPLALQLPATAPGKWADGLGHLFTRPSYHRWIPLHLVFPLSCQFLLFLPNHCLDYHGHAINNKCLKWGIVTFPFIFSFLKFVLATGSCFHWQISVPPQLKHTRFFFMAINLWINLNRSESWCNYSLFGDTTFLSNFYHLLNFSQRKFLVFRIETYTIFCQVQNCVSYFECHYMFVLISSSFFIANI